MESILIERFAEVDDNECGVVQNHISRTFYESGNAMLAHAAADVMDAMSIASSILEFGPKEFELGYFRKDVDVDTALATNQDLLRVTEMILRRLHDLSLAS